MRCPRLTKARRGIGVGNTRSTATAMEPLICGGIVLAGGSRALPRVFLELAQECDDVAKRRVVKRSVSAARRHQHPQDARRVCGHSALLEECDELLVAVLGDELSLAQVHPL